MAALVFANFPPEMRNAIYDELLQHERKAIVLPHLVDVVPGSHKATRSGRDNAHVGIMPFDVNVRLFGKTLRQEYLPLYIPRVINLEITEIVAVVLDFNFDILLDTFIRSITALGRTRLQNVAVTVHLSITKQFAENLLEDRRATSFQRWIQYRDSRRLHGGDVPLTYVVEGIYGLHMGALYFFLNVYKRGIYCNDQSDELDAIYEGFEEWMEGTMHVPGDESDSSDGNDWSDEEEEAASAADGNGSGAGENDIEEDGDGNAQGWVWAEEEDSEDDPEDESYEPESLVTALDGNPSAEHLSHSEDSDIEMEGGPGYGGLEVLYGGTELPGDDAMDEDYAYEAPTHRHSDRYMSSDEDFTDDELSDA